MDKARLAAAILRAEAESPFLRMLLRRRRDVADRLAEAGLDAALAHAAESSRDADVARSLRLERQGVALAVALADLAGAPLETVMYALSDFADRALDRAIAAAFVERVGDEPVVGFAALALGKQGSRELNYSSDIDPILLFDPETMPRRPREDPGEAAVRIARRVLALLQDPTADGYVMRVDLRLRPASEATPLAVPVEAAITHYESSAVPWERAAFIRARAAAGDLMLGNRFLDQIRPFVWRRALDYGAVHEIRSLSHRIRDHHRQGQVLGPGYDVKRGRGGIREIEFFAQIHQLIHGGRDAALRVPATLPALAALADAGHVAPDEAVALADAYRVLRTVEHRLQMVDDRQTHRLPDQPEALDGVARLDGLADGDALIALLAPHAGLAGAIYDQLEQDGSTALPHAPDLLDTALIAAGFDDPAPARARIEGWREGKVRATRSGPAQDALEQVLPALIAALGRGPAPQTALNRFDDLVTRLPSAINLFRLLEARPGLLAMLAEILAYAPTLADALARRAQLLDGLIDASALDLPPDVATVAAELGRGERGDGYEAVLERVRGRVGELRFALGVQLVAGRADPVAIGEGYGRVAEAAIETLGQAAITEFESAHGRIPDGELIILALGRLGGGVLTHASDLDIVFLFTGNFLAESDGRRPLGATTYFNRLAQRMIAALSVPTAAGPLYEVDTRLRPFGGDGLLAVSIDGFVRYQEEGAWTWEHMALTRARPVFGSAEGRGRVQAAIDAALRQARDPATITADAVRMRGEIARHKPPAGPFDVKLIEGGLVDAEFAVQLSQLLHGVGLDPAFDRAARMQEEAGLLAAGFANAAALLTRMLITLRLIAPGSEEPAEQSRAIVARACGSADWGTLLGEYAAARRLIGDEWKRVSGRR